MDDTTNQDEINDIIELVLAGIDDISLLSIPITSPLIDEWISTLSKQKMLLELPRKSTLVVGDIHGDLAHLKKAFQIFKETGIEQIVFLGDIVDRGEKMIECILYLIAEQVKNPDKVFYLRGNHESRSITGFYGFRDMCDQLFDCEFYNSIIRGFEQLPLAASLGSKIFLTHGGIPSKPIDFNLMKFELKPSEILEGIYAELVWNDPTESIDDLAISIRGDQFYYFGKNIFDQFMHQHGLDLFIRAHEVYDEGYKWFFDNRLLSIYSSNIGPYAGVDPYFALIHQDGVELIRADDF